MPTSTYNRKELALQLTDRLQAASDPDWYMALFAAALDETKNAEKAMELADKASSKGGVKSSPFEKSFNGYYTKEIWRKRDKLGREICGEGNRRIPCNQADEKPAKQKPTQKTTDDPSEQSTAHPGAVHGSGVTIKPSKQRAFDGATPIETKTTLTKQETGRVGEAVILAYLKSQGFGDAKPMNSTKTNFPIDMIEDHRPTEVKAGLVSNGRDAQKWRLTFSKETAAEKEAYEKMTPEERTAWNAEKQTRIKQRKEAVIKALEKEKPGLKIQPRTMAVVINPDTRTADIFEFDGWHDIIRWQSDLAKKAYKASVTYSHA